ncbi:MAG TPA: S26 family signal peptidase [Pirellulales bacterium]
MPLRPPGRRRSRGPVRRFVEAIVLLAITAAMASEFLIEGWSWPIIVSSGSMAPAYFGPHRAVRCPDCGMEFDCDADPLLTAATATCPNCGRRGIPLDSEELAGDRLLVDRATFAARATRRWEVALFRCPEQTADYCVKRIVGLPGDAIAIRGGDVYIDGSIARKSLAEQRQTAILVHDTKWSGEKSDLPSRWSPQPIESWQPVGSGFQSAADGTAINWLTYTHWRRGPGGAATIEESPVLDEDGYNASISRPLNPVADLLLVARLSAIGNGTLFLRANDGRQTYQVALEPATGKIALSRNENVLQSIQTATGSIDQPSELLLSLFDRQVLLAIDGRERLVFALAGTGEPLRPTSTPLAIGSRGLKVEITRLQVWRDIYYTASRRAAATEAVTLRPDEYFVLGDNSPISRDSRSWTGGEPVPAALLVGRPLRWSSSGGRAK